MVKKIITKNVYVEITIPYSKTFKVTKEVEWDEEYRKSEEWDDEEYFDAEFA